MAGILVQSVVKRIIKENGKKAGTDFLQTFSDLVENKLKQATAEHNGGRKIMDAAVAKFVFGSK